MKKTFGTANRLYFKLLFIKIIIFTKNKETIIGWKLRGSNLTVTN